MTKIVGNKEGQKRMTRGIQYCEGLHFDVVVFDLGNKVAVDKGAEGRGEAGKDLLNPKEERLKGFLERLAKVDEKEFGVLTPNGEVVGLLGVTIDLGYDGWSKKVTSI